MAEVLYKLKAKNGTYTKDGQEKTNYVDCGVILKGDYGPYILFEKTFNPAGMETEPGRTGVFISMFKDDQQGGAKITPPAAKAKKEFVDDDLPEF